MVSYGQKEYRICHHFSDADVSILLTLVREGCDFSCNTAICKDLLAKYASLWLNTIHNDKKWRRPRA